MVWQWMFFYVWFRKGQLESVATAAQRPVGDIFLDIAVSYDRDFSTGIWSIAC